MPNSSGATRYVAVLVRDRPAPAPPGVDADEFRLALIEDTYEVAAGLELVTAALVLSPPDQPGVAELTWPGTPVIGVGADPTPAAAALAALAERGAEQAALITADAPDLPPLLIGKLFRPLGNADIAVCPAEDGGLVAVAAHLPLADWITGLDLDAPDAYEKLHAAAPARRSVATGPGWHRLRAPADIARLDPGLEGWPSTRALLSGG
jgi:hypothetical protein